ncbi:serine protease [Jannaschia seosinensis]|nr:serine protease [Jannaschia seosinensis]
MRLSLFLPVCLLMLIVALAGPGRAQQNVYVQIEAHPDRATAEERAERYDNRVDPVNGFTLGAGWYAIALGPYEVEQARAELQRLTAEGLIPGDSYLTEGDTYRERFWPTGARSEGETATDDPAAQPEETREEALRSERSLTRADRMDIQRALQWFGHYEGAIDGVFGSGTRDAMAGWQRRIGAAPSGILTTRQRAKLLSDRAEAQAALGLRPITVGEAGIALTAPMGLVAFDRIEAPFVHYAPADGSGIRLSLISQAGDARKLAGLYEVLQTLEAIPPEGDRARERDTFRITGLAPDRTTQAFARLTDGHIVGYILSWPERQDPLASAALAEMERTLASVGAPLPSDAGLDPAEQSVDMVSGLEVRKPQRSGSGFYADAAGAVVTASANVAGCGRITIDGRHDASVTAEADGIAILRPGAALAPSQVAALAPAVPRLRSRLAVGGFPYGGLLSDAALTFGTLADVRGLRDEDVLRLQLSAQPGDVGGPVLDDAGRVVGMLLPAQNGDDRILPDDVAFAAKPEDLRAVLATAGVEETAAAGDAALSPEELAAQAAAITVLIGCWN